MLLGCAAAARAPARLQRPSCAAPARAAAAHAPHAAIAAACSAAPGAHPALRRRTRCAAMEMDVTSAASGGDADWTLPAPSAEESVAARAQLKRRLLGVPPGACPPRHARGTPRVNSHYCDYARLQRR
jgi:hypothetical protein